MTRSGRVTIRVEGAEVAADLARYLSGAGWMARSDGEVVVAWLPGHGADGVARLDLALLLRAWRSDGRRDAIVV